MKKTSKTNAPLNNVKQQAPNRPDAADAIFGSLHNRLNQSRAQLDDLMAKIEADLQALNKTQE